ncbi:hypothetical protein ACGRHY_14360 [Streptomyces sp. HK10]|uniref:hypothetical protein n=1 Tax=Streptomyces sp. HK10 TaxID=3373255 RepID=UPI0037487603
MSAHDKLYADRRAKAAARARAAVEDARALDLSDERAVYQMLGRLPVVIEDLLDVFDGQDPQDGGEGR